MFGFDKVAAFTHEFETAFDRVRKGEIKPTAGADLGRAGGQGLYPRADRGSQSTDDSHRRCHPRRPQALRGCRDAACCSLSPSSPEAPPLATRESKQAGWHLYLEFDRHILRNGSNPLDLLEDLCKLGPCFVVPVTDGIPFLDEMEPEDCYLKWDVKLHAACDKDAIDDVFMFVLDEMKLTLSPFEQSKRLRRCHCSSFSTRSRLLCRDGRAGRRGLLPRPSSAARCRGRAEPARS